MDSLWMFFWFCWTFIFGFVFIDKSIKSVKSKVIHFYFRGQAHFDVETEINNKQQLQEIEELFLKQKNNLVLMISDSRKLTKSQINELRKLLEELKLNIDGLDRED